MLKHSLNHGTLRLSSRDDDEARRSRVVVGPTHFLNKYSPKLFASLVIRGIRNAEAQYSRLSRAHSRSGTTSHNAPNVQPAN